MILSSRFQQALDYVCIVHAGHIRKGSQIPYISHLLSVAALTMEYGANEDEAIAALLHDAVEDAGGKPRLEDIRLRFGEAVAEIVDGCTDADETPKPPWCARKEAYIAHLSKASPSILLVSSCDKLHNARSIVSDLRDIGETIWDRFKGKKEGTLWYYRSLVSTFQKLGAPDRLIDELDRTVTIMEKMASS